MLRETILVRINTEDINSSKVFGFSLAISTTKFKASAGVFRACSFKKKTVPSVSFLSIPLAVFAFLTNVGILVSTLIPKPLTSGSKEIP